MNITDSVVEESNNFSRRHFLLALLLLVIPLSILFSSPSYAQAARVSVTINSVGNIACIDQFIFCGKADMMVRVGLRQSDGIVRTCPDSIPVRNLDNIGPFTICTGTIVSTPFELIITVFDVDESKLPSRAEIQSEIRLSPQGSGFALPFFRLNGTPQTISGAQANVSLTAFVTTLAPAFAAPTLTLSRTSIDPSLPGEVVLASGRVVISGTPTMTFPTGVRAVFSVQSPAGAVTNIADGVLPASGFNIDWDGKLDGRLAPAGIYQLRVMLRDTGQTISAPVTVTSVASIFEARLATADPWNSRAGPISVAYRLSPRGSIAYTVEGPSAAGSACTLGPLPIVVPNVPSAVLNAGNGILPVQMKTPAGKPLPVGSYCVRMRATNPTGGSIGTQNVELNVATPSALRLVANLIPAVPWIRPTTTALDASGIPQPVPVEPTFVEVRVLDEAGNLRPTGSITVRAIPFLIIPVPAAFITTKTCIGVSVCKMQIGQATLTRATEVIFDANAVDLASTDAADPSPAAASFPQRAAALVWAPQNRAGPVSVPVKGSIAAGFNNVDHNRVQDVAFHAGTGIDITIPAQATQLSDGIGSILNLFFGGDAAVGANSVTIDKGQSVAFWLTRTPAVIDTDPPYSGSPAAPLCRRTRVESVSFADMQAVIHNVNCRDNADANHASFSAEFSDLAKTTWHEFHHAAYDLSDEYAPDAPYFQTPVLPNVMRNSQECALYGASPPECVQIGTTGWWRSGPVPDVMIGNTRENEDDLRRARMMQNQCSTGGC